MMDEVIVIAGPTGVGKSDLAVDLALRIDAEIVSADSVQIYKGLTIGSAKIKTEEMKGIRHHMIDVLEPWEDCDVVKFRDMARSCIDDILSRGKKVIVAGGTGFYIQAIVRDVEFAKEAVDMEYRNSLYDMAKSKDGTERLHEMLTQVDRQSAAEIEKNNVKRVIRALEFYHSTKESLSVHNEKERKKRDYYKNKVFVLYDERENLYKRIDLRVDKMMNMGLEKEVRDLYAAYPNSRIVNTAIGYKEIIGLIKGEYAEEEAVRLIKRNTRHFAKRQLTYFKIQMSSIFLNINQGEEKKINFILERV